MITLIFLTSLKIVFMYGAMQEGNIFFPLRQAFIWLLSKTPLEFERYAKKPLYDCLFCMSSFWGIAFTWNYVTWELSLSFFSSYLLLLFSIAGFNYLVALLIAYVHTYQEAMGERIEITAPALPEPKENYSYNVFRDGVYLGIGQWINDRYHGYCFGHEEFGSTMIYKDVDYWTLVGE